MARHLVSLALLLISALLLAGLAPAAVAAPPSGFLDTLVASVPSPTALAWTPDGRMLVTTQTGQLRVFQNGAPLATALDLRAPNLACVEHERGLLGLAVDPSFATNPYVYVLYTHDAPIGGSAPRWNDACPDPPGANTLSLRSDPPGVQLALDTGGVTTPASHMVMAGSSHQLIAPEIQNHRSFSTWADGESARVRSFTVGTLPLTYTASYVNQPPAATASVAPGQMPFDAAFAITQAADPEGDALTYHWDFGDGQAAESPNAMHTYAAPGSYRAALSVADQLGLTSSYSFVLLIDRHGQVTRGVQLNAHTRLPLVVR